MSESTTEKKRLPVWAVILIVVLIVAVPFWPPFL